MWCFGFVVVVVVGFYPLSHSLKYLRAQGSQVHNTCTYTLLDLKLSLDRTSKEAPQPTSSLIQVSQPSTPLPSFALLSTPTSRHCHPPLVPALAFNAPPCSHRPYSLNSCPRTSLTFPSSANPHPLQTVVTSSFNWALHMWAQDLL